MDWLRWQVPANTAVKLRAFKVIEFIDQLDITRLKKGICIELDKKKGESFKNRIIFIHLQSEQFASCLILTGWRKRLICISSFI
jgi:hypothetical protein